STLGCRSVCLVTQPSPPGSYTLSLHDALPILRVCRTSGIQHAPGRARGSIRLARRHREHVVPGAAGRHAAVVAVRRDAQRRQERSEEHTSELQSPCNLVCRLLLEKKKKQAQYP